MFKYLLQVGDIEKMVLGRLFVVLWRGKWGNGRQSEDNERVTMAPSWQGLVHKSQRDIYEIAVA